VRAINVKYALRIEVRSLVGERVAKFFLDVFVALFVIIDPAGTVPVFPGLTKGRSDRGRNRLAWQAAIVAFGRDRGIRTFRPAMRFAGGAAAGRLWRGACHQVAGLLLAAIAGHPVANSAIAFTHSA